MTVELTRQSPGDSSAHAPPLPLIMFSGMGADDSLFRCQRDEFPQLVVPEWGEPRRKETLASYGRRMAERIDPGVPCVVGGASFGGMVALEAARHLRTKCCVVISGILTRAQLPWKYKWLSPLASTIPGICTDAAGLATKLAVSVSRMFRSANPVSPLRHIADERGLFLRWAGVAALRWKPKEFRFPIAQIHGDADTVFPINRVQPQVVVPGGGHVLPLTHPDEVNAFLTAQMNAAATAR